MHCLLFHLYDCFVVGFDVVVEDWDHLVRGRGSGGCEHILHIDAVQVEGGEGNQQQF